MDNRIDKQLAFSLEIDKVKNIFRQTHLSGFGRNENDAEHSWHMAIMAYLLREYANEEVDIAKVMLMCLIHDIVEIDAGDTYAYDEEAKATQHEREIVGAKRIFGILPEDQRDELFALWQEFEAGESKEAKFARTMDNIQPMMLNDATDGKAWLEHQVALSKILKRNEPTEKGSKVLWDYSKTNFLKKNVECGTIRNDVAEEF